MTTGHDDPGYAPPQASSPTDHVLAELQLYGVIAESSQNPTLSRVEQLGSWVSEGPEGVL